MSEKLTSFLLICIGSDFGDMRVGLSLEKLLRVGKVEKVDLSKQRTF